MASDWQLLLERGDPKALRAAWKHAAPHLPQPKTDHEAEVTMHMARTASVLMPMKLRRYSHDWLLERNLPSQLPPEEQPRIAEAVGISVNFRSAILMPAANEVRGAMEAAVEDCYANGDTAVAIVQGRMAEAKQKTMKALFGR
jgi:hypothetical protein